MKKGDTVVYIEHHEHCMDTDPISFTIGKLYIVSGVVENSDQNYSGIRVHNGTNEECFMFHSQYKIAVPNNELSRVLYPNWVEHGKYLIPEEK